ncbi:hypothetical protein VPH35_104022 [Triticum aestivum]
MAIPVGVDLHHRPPAKPQKQCRCYLASASSTKTRGLFVLFWISPRPSCFWILASSMRTEDSEQPVLEVSQRPRGFAKYHDIRSPLETSSSTTVAPKTLDAPSSSSDMYNYHLVQDIKYHDDRRHVPPTPH